MSERLTLRELQCVRLAGEGLSDKEIRIRLGMRSHRTVQSHLNAAYRKLGVTDRFAAFDQVRTNYAEVPIPIAEAPNALSPDGAIDERRADGQSAISNSWPLPRPPAPRWRLVWIVVFAAVGALLTVGIVGVITTASQQWATQAPPNAIRSLD